MHWFKSCILSWLAILSPNVLAAASDELFVPPPGLKFRLIGYKCGQAIFANNDRYPKNTLQLYPANQAKHGDQWWTLQNATDGRYFIRSSYRGNDNYVMFANSDAVGIYEKDYPDQHFTFEQTDGQVELDQEGQYFRILEPEENVVLFCRRGETLVGKHPADQKKHSDQYFSFDFEETEVYDVKFDLESGKRSEPDVKIVTAKAINKDSKPVTMTPKLTEGLSEKSKFERTSGFSLTVGTSITVHAIPEVISGEIKLETTASTSVAFGKETERKKDFENSIAVTVSPKSVATVTGKIERWTLDVPATIYSRPKWDKGKRVQIITKALYRGVSLSDITWTNELQTSS